MQSIYVIKLTHLLGAAKDKSEYHSVWKSKQSAESVAQKLNEKHGREFQYTVEEKFDFEVRKTLGMSVIIEISVKFSDSVGWICFADNDPRWLKALFARSFY